MEEIGNDAAAAADGRSFFASAALGKIRSPVTAFCAAKMPHEGSNFLFRWISSDFIQSNRPSLRFSGIVFGFHCTFSNGRSDGRTIPLFSLDKIQARLAKLGTTCR
jgi:hypothetical protein